MTRIRVSLIEGGKLDLISLKKINGVYGVLGKSTELQIVVGPGDAQEMAEALITIINQK
jgi:N-acetylmuramic acid-specific PTS system IIC component